MRATSSANLRKANISLLSQASFLLINEEVEKVWESRQPYSILVEIASPQCLQQENPEMVY